MLVIRRGAGDDHFALLKRFVRWHDDALEVEQHDPQRKIRLPKRTVKSVHRIVGHFDRR